jgi:hypothetical protein
MKGKEAMPNSARKTSEDDRNPVVVTTLSSPLAAPANPAKNNDSWEFLSNEQARTLRTICDRIIPEDDFPSASQAGVLNFIDHQLSQRLRAHRETYRLGLEAIEEISRNRFGREISWLQRPHQAEVLAEFERLHKEIFDIFRSHTVEGYYGPQRTMKGSSFAPPRPPSSGSSDL